MAKRKQKGVSVHEVGEVVERTLGLVRDTLENLEAQVAAEGATRDTSHQIAQLTQAMSRLVTDSAKFRAATISQVKKMSLEDRVVLAAQFLSRQDPGHKNRAVEIILKGASDD